ncbi:MAG: NUDIX hydrolase [Caulobacterales bacterium]
MQEDDWPGEDNPWTVLAPPKRSFENDWFAIEEQDVLKPNGAPGYYGVVRFRRVAVGVLPIEADGLVHLVGQWRFPLGRYSWEMPEGGAEPGEDPADCAGRELAEETGLRAADLVEILRMDLSNSITDEVSVLFLATGLTQGEAAPEETEALQRRSAHFSDVLARVADGRITDCLTVAAILRAHHMAVTGELPEALAQAMLAPK